MAVQNDSEFLRKSIRECKNRIDSEMANFNAIYESSSKAIERFTTNFKRLSVASVVIPFVAGVLTLLLALASEYRNVIIFVSGVLSLLLGAIQLLWQNFGVAGRIGIHKVLCDQIESVRSRVARELPTSELIDSFPENRLSAEQANITRLRDHVLDKHEECHKLLTSLASALIQGTKEVARPPRGKRS